MKFIAAFALLLSPLQVYSQAASPVQSFACRRTVSGKPYTIGGTIKVTLNLRMKPGISYRADMALVNVNQGTVSQAAIPQYSLIAFGVGLNDTQVRFSFQIPAEHISGVYVINGITVRQTSGEIVTAQGGSLDQITGTCLHFEDPTTRGLDGNITGGVVEPQ